MKTECPRPIEVDRTEKTAHAECQECPPPCYRCPSHQWTPSSWGRASYRQGLVSSSVILMPWCTHLTLLNNRDSIVHPNPCARSCWWTFDCLSLVHSYMCLFVVIAVCWLCFNSAGSETAPEPEPARGHWQENPWEVDQCWTEASYRQGGPQFLLFTPPSDSWPSQRKTGLFLLAASQQASVNPLHKLNTVVAL